MKKKKLLIAYYSMGMGGIEKRIRDFVSEISKEYPQWEVHLILRDAESSYFLDQMRLSHVRFIYHQYPFFDKSPILFGFVYWYIWKYFCILPDVVLTFDTNLSYVVLLVSKILFFWKKTRVVVNASIVISRYIAITKERLSSYALKYIYPLSDEIIVPTNVAKNDLVDRYKILPKKIFVVPTWTLFKPTSIKTSIHYDIAYIGRYAPEKNPLLFLEIVRMVKDRIPNFHAVMVGEGVLYETILRYINKYDLKKTVILLPFQNDIAKIFYKTKILVVPSLNEGLPNVVLEAGMCLVPSVTSVFPGAREAVVNGKTGYIAGTKKELCDSIFYLLKHESVRKNMGKQAQAYMMKYHSDNVQKRYIHLLLHS